MEILREQCKEEDYRMKYLKERDVEGAAVEGTERSHYQIVEQDNGRFGTAFSRLFSLFVCCQLHLFNQMNGMDRHFTSPYI